MHLIVFIKILLILTFKIQSNGQNFGEPSYFPVNYNEEPNFNNLHIGNQQPASQPTARSIIGNQIQQNNLQSQSNQQIEIIEPNQIEPSMIAPCRMNNHTKELECFGPEVTNTALENVFRSIDVKGVFKGLKLYKTDVTYLDKQMFFEFAAQSIDIDGNHNLSLNSLHRITFVRSKDVMKRFKYAGILYSTWAQKQPNDGAIFEVVDGFQHLELFSVTDTNIPKLQRSVFGRCELISLKMINLARNEIHEVGDYAFYRVPNITCIILKENYIRNITNHTFAFEKSSDEILTIDLSTNLIQSEAIARNAFTRLNRPVILNLHYNLLTYLDEDTFKPVLDDERSSIIVTSNKIGCDCKMKWLVSDSHNYIDRVHGLVCSGHEQKGTEIWYFTSYFLESACNETIVEADKVTSNSEHLKFINYPIGLLIFFIWLVIAIDFDEICP